jgi:hypothetical protein
VVSDGVDDLTAFAGIGYGHMTVAQIARIAHNTGR